MGKIFENRDKGFEIAMILAKKIASTVSVSAEEAFLFFEREGFSIEDIAEFARVQSTDPYFWISKRKIPEEVKDRLLQIHKLLTETRSSLGRLCLWWDSAEFTEQSLRNLFREQRLDISAIRKTLRILWPLIDEEERKYPDIPRERGQENCLLADLGEVCTDYDN